MYFRNKKVQQATGGKKQSSLFKFMASKTRQETPYGIALLYGPNSHPELRKFSQTQQTIIIDQSLKTFLSSSIIDLVVVGTSASHAFTDRCLIFDELCPKFVIPHERKYVLYDVNSGSRDLSLNRCSGGRLDNFLPEVFKLGAPSPGKTNDCSGSSLLQILSRVEDESDPPSSFQASPVRDGIDPMDACVPTSSFSRKRPSSETFVALAAEMASASREEDNTCQELGNLDLSERLGAARKKLKLLHEQNPAIHDVLPWEDESGFSNEWMDQLRRYHSR